MAVYYVATNGNSANAGTIDAPWADITDANGRVSPGDTVYIRGGTYNNSSRPALSVGTASGAPVFFRRYRNEQVFITARDDYDASEFTATPEPNIWAKEIGRPDPLVNDNECGVWYNNKTLAEQEALDKVNTNGFFYSSGVEFLYINVGDAVEPSGTVSVSFYSAIRFSGCGNVFFERLIFAYSFKGLGRMSLLGDSAHTGSTTLEACVFYRIAQNGVQPMERNWVFDQCLFYEHGSIDALTFTNNYAYCVYTGSDSRPSTFKGNIFFRSALRGYQLHLYPSGPLSGGHVVEDNTSIGNDTGSAFVIADDNGGNTIRGNTVIGRRYSSLQQAVFFGAVIRKTGNKIYNNRFVRLNGWIIQHSTPGLVNDYRGNKVWNCPAYTYSQGSTSTYDVTKWQMTAPIASLFFTHNGSTVNPGGTNAKVHRSAWSAQAPFMLFEDMQDDEPTEQSALNEHLAKYPDCGWFTLFPNHPAARVDIASYSPLLKTVNY
ncbi:MAG: right-handed parallel beta-helix repeat-containing protein [Desulfurellales bacterium]|nr:MAG: right-handed parallel beta-helix repeat-containing protein [Desulfurellales bacterium]